MYSVGQKVVCVDDVFRPEVAQLYRNLPKKDQIYTVRQVYLGRANGRRDASEVGLLLHALVNDPDPFCKADVVMELGFNSERFAPLQTLPGVEAEEESWEQKENRQYEKEPGVLVV
jgi:hypothetical protein